MSWRLLRLPGYAEQATGCDKGGQAEWARPCSPFSAPVATTSARTVPVPLLTSIAKRAPGCCHHPWATGDEWPDRRLPVTSGEHVRIPRRLSFSAGPALKRADRRGGDATIRDGQRSTKRRITHLQRTYTLREANNGLGRWTVCSPAACHSTASRGPPCRRCQPPISAPRSPGAATTTPPACGCGVLTCVGASAQSAITAPARKFHARPAFGKKPAPASTDPAATGKRFVPWKSRWGSQTVRKQCWRSSANAWLPWPWYSQAPPLAGFSSLTRVSGPASARSVPGCGTYLVQPPRVLAGAIAPAMRCPCQVPAGAPMAPASARPALGGRFAPAGTGAGLGHAGGQGLARPWSRRAGKGDAFPEPPDPAGAFTGMGPVFRQGGWKSTFLQSAKVSDVLDAQFAIPPSRGPLRLHRKLTHQRPAQPRCRHHHAPCLRLRRVDLRRRVRTVGHHCPRPQDHCQNWRQTGGQQGRRPQIPRQTRFRQEIRPSPDRPVRYRQALCATETAASALWG